MESKQQRWALPLAAIIPALSLAVTCVPAHARTWKLTPGGSGDAPTIHAAFQLASPGDVIELGPGVYRDLNFGGPTPEGRAYAVAHMTPGVSIQSSAGALFTIIDGQDDHHGLVGTDLGAVEIRGITFRKCRSRGVDGGVEKWGGGVMVFNSTVRVTRCLFLDCVAPNGLDGGGGGGGGLFLYGGTGSEVLQNLFLRCNATDIGGGMEAFETNATTVAYNTFVANSARRGGGALLLNNTTSNIQNNIFALNSAGSVAGAIWCLNSHSENAQCNLFWRNTAPSQPDVDACDITPGVAGNVVADPLFCQSAADVYAVSASSLAAAESGNSCGQRGAFDAACPPVPVDGSSWGAIKTRFR